MISVTGPHAIIMRYTNYRGEVATRTIIPGPVSFKATEYHPEPQWIMQAFDLGKSAYRDFALRDCDFTSPVARPGEEWHEGEGAVMWWRFPMEEPPWAGTPLDSDWPGYHTHWTPIPRLPAPSPTKEA